MAKGLPDSKKHIKERQAPLRFGADGKFRILHLTDIHEVHTGDNPSEKCPQCGKPASVFKKMQL